MRASTSSIDSAWTGGPKRSRWLRALVAACALLPIAAAVGWVVAGVAYRLMPVWGLAVAAAPLGLTCAALAAPAAWRKCRSLRCSAPGFQALLLLLLMSTLLGAFFADASIRTANETEDNPVSSVSLARVILVGLAGFVTVVVAVSRRENPVRRVRGPLFWMLAYSVLACASAVYATSPLIAAGKALEVVVDVVFFIVVVSSLSAVQVARLWNLLLLFVMLILAGVWLSAIVDPSAGFLYLPGALIPLLVGANPTVHPNNIGQFGAILAVVAFSRLLRRPQRPDNAERGLWAGVLLFGLVCLVFSQARTSVAGLAAALIVSVCLYRKVGLASLAGLIGMGLAAAGFEEVLTEFLRRGQDPEALFSLSGRAYYWQEAWDFFKESALLGHGFYTGPRLDLSARYLALDLSTADNTFLDVLLGVGVVGLVPLLIAIVLLVKGLWPSGGAAEIGNDLQNTRKEMLAVMVIILFRSATGPTFETHGINLLIVLTAIAFVQTLRRPSAAGAR